MKLAIDIGTTTIGMCLFDNNKKSFTTIPNPNRIHGADVISRMKNAAEQGLADKLKQDLETSISSAIHALSNDIDFTFNNIEIIVIAANVAMTHIFLGMDVSGMLDSPFTPKTLDMISYTWNGVPTTVFCGLSPFVGGDISSGIYSLDLYRTLETSLLVDLGTNGEIALCTPSGITASSTAAGPAFEGANISCGTAATTGAIDSVSIKNNFCQITTIDNTLPAKGICGSGLIEAVYALLEDGLIDSHGTFVSDIHRRDGFILYHDPFSSTTVSISQDDIRNFQTAKAAICAGIIALCEFAHVTFDEISKVYIAGSFGKHINILHAANLGVIPKQLSDKAIACGNTSLAGAIKLADNPSDTEVIKKTASRSTCINLADSSAFGDAYVHCMDFDQD